MADINNELKDFMRDYVVPGFVGTLDFNAYHTLQWLRSGVDPVEAKRKLELIMFENQWIYDGVALSNLIRRLEIAASKLGVN